MNNLFLAYICNDIKNSEFYHVDEIGECFYNNISIGKLEFKISNKQLNVYFQPYKPVESITVTLNINKEGQIQCQ